MAAAAGQVELFVSSKQYSPGQKAGGGTREVSGAKPGGRKPEKRWTGVSIDKEAVGRACSNPIQAILEMHVPTAKGGVIRDKVLESDQRSSI